MKAYTCNLALGRFFEASVWVSVASLHRESTDSLIVTKRKYCTYLNYGDRGNDIKMRIRSRYMFDRCTQTSKHMQKLWSLYIGVAGCAVTVNGVAGQCGRQDLVKEGWKRRAHKRSWFFDVCGRPSRAMRACLDSVNNLAGHVRGHVCLINQDRTWTSDED